MIKMLDYLNNREINVNTVDGARDALYLLLNNNQRRINHVEGVVRHTKEICKERDIDSFLAEICVMSAYLHDIGYSEEFKFADFHAIDGFTYLQSNNWIKPVQMTALYHSHSDILANMSRSDVLPIYNNNKPSEIDTLVIKIVTKADLTTSPEGEKVSFEERILDIKNRYGEDDVIYKHILKVRNIIGTDI